MDHALPKMTAVYRGLSSGLTRRPDLGVGHKGEFRRTGDDNQFAQRQLETDAVDPTLAGCRAPTTSINSFEFVPMLAAVL
jgi:hypothetical protein